MKGKYALRAIALLYLAAILLVPVAAIFLRTFRHGFAPVWDAITQPDALHALVLTLKITVIAVVANTIFGVIAAMVLVRQRFWGQRLVDAVIDLPFAVSPVVIGLALIFVYGSVSSPVGRWLLDHGVRVIFATPGMVLAVMFVSLPFVVRETVPVLREAGTDQEEAAHTLGASALSTFWRVTLPSIRAGVAYGVVLATARSLGEFGALAVVSGHLSGETETLTLYVQDHYENYDLTGAYSAAVLLALIAIAVLVAMRVYRTRGQH